jgi:mono/diheme cytochrome c family protein
MKRVFVVAALLVIGYGARVQMRAPAPLPVRSAPASGEDTAVARGHAVYDRYGCAGCHGADGKGGFPNLNSETEGKVPGVTFVAEGFTRGELRKKILDGFAAVGRKDANGPRPPYRMPGWAGQMSDGEVADLVEYLWSLYPKSETQKWR